MIIAMRRTMIGAVLISVGIYAEKRAEKYSKKNKRWTKRLNAFSCEVRGGVEPP